MKTLVCHHLHMLFTSPGGVDYPSPFRVDDALLTVKEMGGRVVRYTALCIPHFQISHFGCVYRKFKEL
jgi:hypothetical protein